jgi:bifunctional DNase/RNase
MLLIFIKETHYVLCEVGAEAEETVDDVQITSERETVFYVRYELRSSDYYPYVCDTV